MRVLYEAKDSIDAHMLNNLLVQQGLRTRVDGDYLQGGIGEIQAFGLSRIMVSDEDFEAAQRVVKNWKDKNTEQNANVHTAKVDQSKRILFWTCAATLIAITMLITSFY